MEESLYELAEKMEQEIPHIKKEGEDLLREVNQKFKRLSTETIAQKTMEFFEQTSMYKMYIFAALHRLYKYTESEELYQIAEEAQKEFEKFQLASEAIKAHPEYVSKDDWRSMLTSQVHQLPGLIEEFATLVKLLLAFENEE